MMSSSDNFLEMLRNAPEPVPPSDPVQTAALARIAVALYHWLPVAREMESRLAANADPDTAARSRILREEVAEALKEGGIEIEDLSARPLSELLDRVQVVAWRRDPAITVESVGQVIEPVVRCHGTVIRRGKIVGLVQPDQKTPPAPGSPS